MLWLQLIGSEKIGTLMLLDELATGTIHGLRKYQGLERSLRLDLKQQAAVSTIECARHILAVLPGHPKVFDEAVRELVVLLGTFLRGQSLNCAAQQPLITRCAGFDETDNEIGTWHDLGSATAAFASRLRILKSSEAFEISCGDQRGDRLPVSMKDDSFSLIGDSVNDVGKTVAHFADT